MYKIHMKANLWEMKVNTMKTEEEEMEMDFTLQKNRGHKP